MVATRRVANQIHYLNDTSGKRIPNIEEIQNHCIDYFTSLFGTDPWVIYNFDRDMISILTPYTCDEATKVALQTQVNTDEIKRDIKALPRDRCPGPDNFTGEFFKASWDVIWDDLISTIQKLFSSGKLLKQWNATVVALIPKKVGANRLSVFRPIFLLQLVYKVVSKILACRLEELLPSIISNSHL